MQKLLLVNYYSENRATSQIWKVLPNMFFSSNWGEKWRRSEHAACKLSWTLFSPAWEERRVQGQDYRPPKCALPFLAACKGWLRMLRKLVKMLCVKNNNLNKGTFPYQLCLPAKTAALAKSRVISSCFSKLNDIENSLGRFWIKSPYSCN